MTTYDGRAQNDPSLDAGQSPETAQNRRPQFVANGHALTIMHDAQPRYGGLPTETVGCPPYRARLEFGTMSAI